MGASRLVFAGLASALLAGCSSDVSRFADFGSNPFQSSARVEQPAPFNSAQQVASAAPVSRVESAPLSAPIQSAPLSAPTRAVAAPALSQPRVIASAPVRAPAMSPNIAAAKAVIAAQPTQATKTVADRTASTSKAVADKTASTHKVVAEKVEAAKAPVTSVAKVEPVKAAAPVVEATKPVRTASLEPQTSAKSDAAPTSTVVATEDASPEFRWPARGRIIQGFKAGKSEGISIAVPEGTAVKAAEGGTVAYAGSELKGYGNLVLIRHPNGFVSAYAHNGELMVKRGETVKRGQVVAKSGQSGDVSSPQLQFQLRKGSTPVDPTQYLAGL